MELFNYSIQEVVEINRLTDNEKYIVNQVVPQLNNINWVEHDQYELKDLKSLKVLDKWKEIDHVCVDIMFNFIPINRGKCVCCIPTISSIKRGFITLDSLTIGEFKMMK